MSLSPVVRSGVSGVTPLPLFAQFVGVAFGSQNFWLSSKSMFVVPDGFCTRDQNSSRNLPVPAVSVNTPNFFRSLLFGGIAPLTMVGFAVSSFVPWPKLSSPPPLGLSSFASTPGRRLVPVPPASQSMQSAGPSTFRLALTSISKLLPVSVFAVEHAADAVAPPPAMANTAMNVGDPGQRAHTEWASPSKHSAWPPCWTDAELGPHVARRSLLRIQRGRPPRPSEAT